VRVFPFISTTFIASESIFIAALFVIAIKEFVKILQQKDLVAHHKKKGVYIVPYFPLMHGRFCEVPELVEIGEKHGVSGALISLAWLMNKGTVPIPKSINPVHLKANWESQKIKLSSEDIKLIDSISKEKRFLNPPFMAPKW